MLNCRKCGSQIEDDSLYCKKCGAKVYDKKTLDVSSKLNSENLTQKWLAFTVCTLVLNLLFQNTANYGFNTMSGSMGSVITYLYELDIFSYSALVLLRFVTSIGPALVGISIILFIVALLINKPVVNNISSYIVICLRFSKGAVILSFITNVIFCLFLMIMRVYNDEVLRLNIFAYVYLLETISTIFVLSKCLKLSEY